MLKLFRRHGRTSPQPKTTNPVLIQRDSRLIETSQGNYFHEVRTCPIGHKSEAWTTEGNACHRTVGFYCADCVVEYNSIRLEIVSAPHA